MRASPSHKPWSTGALIALATLLFCALASQPSLAAPNPFEVSIRPLQVGDRLPAIDVVDQRGRHFDLSALGTQPTVVGFIYTGCKDECPITTRKFARLDTLLGQGSYRLLEVTIDPAHDSARAIAAYAAREGVRSPRWQIVTGDVARLETLARSAGLSVVDDGRGELIHNTRLLVLGADGRVADIIGLAAWDPHELAARMQDLAGHRANPIAEADLALTKSIAQFCGGSNEIASGIIDVVAVVLVVGVGAFVAIWMGRRVFHQGA